MGWDPPGNPARDSYHSQMTPEIGVALRLPWKGTHLQSGRISSGQGGDREGAQLWTAGKGLNSV
jgi:hypothetical protein